MIPNQKILLDTRWLRQGSTSVLCSQHYSALPVLTAAWWEERSRTDARGGTVGLGLLIARPLPVAPDT